MVKEAMRNYFERLLKAWYKLGSLPQAALVEEADPRLHVGELDEESGMVCWKPWLLDVDEKPDYAQMEAQFGRVLHSSVKTYLGTYLFYEMNGKYRHMGLMLTPVYELELLDFVHNCTGYLTVHGHLEYAPVGIEADGALLVAVHNDSGEVFLEEYISKYEKIADSLDQLIHELRV